jgi:AraC family ethanolamine operon transcriptional activator
MVIRYRVRDFEELSERAKGWRIELSKLDARPFNGEVLQWVTADLILSRGRFDGRVKQAGEPPPGFRTFAVPASDEARFLWRGKQVGGNDVLAFPLGGELDAVSRPGFDVFTVSIRDEACGEAASALGLQGLEHWCQALEVFPASPERMRRLRRVLTQEIARAEDADPGAAHDRILVELVRGLEPASAGIQPSRRSSARRQRAVQEAGRCVLDRPLNPPTVGELCVVTGVSKRTLEYAFAEHVGVRPKAYVKALRLNAVRRLLRSGSVPTMRVADAANAWGFWHMGQFAADYRTLLGELPSETLRGKA